MSGGRSAGWRAPWARVLRTLAPGVVVVLGVVGVVGVVAAGAATAAPVDDPTGPRRHDLVLRVDRLERAEQSDASGSARSAMLFVPDDSAAIAAAARARADARRSGTAALFLADPVRYREGRTTRHLFPARDAADPSAARRTGAATPASDGPGVAAGARVPGPAAGGIGALVVAGGVASWRFGTGTTPGGRPW